MGDLFAMERFCPEGDSEQENSSAILENLKQRAKKARLTKTIQANKDGTPSAEVPKAAENTQKDGKKKKKKGRIDKPEDKEAKNESSEEADQGKGEVNITALGEELNRNRRTVKRVLPRWLAQPEIISADLKQDRLAVEDMQDLDAQIVDTLKKNNIHFFFPVQRKVIPWLLNSERFRFFRPNDLCVSAPTGSGKTLAFVVPIVQSLKHRVVPRVRALVVLPVQELVAQVYKVFHTFCDGTPLKVRMLSGHKSFAAEQAELVRAGVDSMHVLADIIVSTPGRLVDHIQKTNGFSLEYLRYLIIDEADRVVEDVQNDWLTHVLNAVFKRGSRLHRTQSGSVNVASATTSDQNLPLQKLLFSATLTNDPEVLQRLSLYEPKMFTSVVDPKTLRENQQSFVMPSELCEFVVHCKDSILKPLVLLHLIQSRSMKKVLVFTRSIANAHLLSVLLRQFHLATGELSSKVQEKRSKVLSRFRQGHLDVLVCTDALARGIDIGDVDYVISYDCPKFAKTYIHRVGRTARAGKAGTAFTLVSDRDRGQFFSLLQNLGKRNQVQEVKVDHDQLDRSAYEKARETTALILKEEAAKKADKKSFALGTKKRPRESK